METFSPSLSPEDAVGLRKEVLSCGQRRERKEVLSCGQRREVEA